MKIAELILWIVFLSPFIIPIIIFISELVVNRKWNKYMNKYIEHHHCNICGDKRSSEMIKYCFNKFRMVCVNKNCERYLEKSPLIHIQDARIFTENLNKGFA